MSFAYLPLYTGDYLRDTRHLTPLKHGIFVLLLMHCWDQKGPLPLDEQECAGIANCRSADEVEALRYVISRYFVAMTDGFYNHRMQKEIERSEAISDARSKAGKKGYQAIAKQLPGKSRASASIPTPIPKPTLKPNQPPPTPPTPDWLPAEAWSNFVSHRKAKRAPLTPRAVELLLAKLDRLRQAGKDPVAIIEQSIEQGWTGLFETRSDKPMSRTEQLLKGGL